MKWFFLVGLVFWFGVDSTGSFLSGFYLNILLNVGFLLPFLIALKLVKPQAAG